MKHEEELMDNCSFLAEYEWAKVDLEFNKNFFTEEEIKEKELLINNFTDDELYYLFGSENDDYLDDYQDYIGNMETINILDIPKDSMMQVPLICDKCKKEYKMPNRQYLYHNSLFKEDLCRECIDKYFPYSINTVPTSSQQIYLCKLLNGKLNYPIGNCNVDILIDNIIIEYDGSGHYLGVNFGQVTWDEKIEKDRKRDFYLASKGYKIIRIKCSDDKLPNDNTILNKINQAKRYFEESGKSYYEIVFKEFKPILHK